MRRIIFLLYISINFINFVNGQNDVESRLMLLEKEYFISENDTVRNQILVSKIEFLLIDNVVSPRVLEEVKRVEYDFLEEKQQRDFLWNAALISYLNKDTYYALYFLDRYEEECNDVSTEKELLKLLIYVSYDTSKAQQIIDTISKIDKDLNCLNCLNYIQNVESKHQKFAEIISYIIPGSGMLLQGDLLKGSTTLALNTTVVLIIRWMFLQHQYLNMISWGTNLIQKFYLGNIRLTQRMIENKNNRIRKKAADSCQANLENILKQYPLEFKKML